MTTHTDPHAETVGLHNGRGASRPDRHADAVPIASPGVAEAIAATRPHASRPVPPLLATGAQREPGAPASDVPVPSGRLGQYELIRQIGCGGMGTVYQARDLRLGRLVAIKLLARLGSHDNALFLAEARVTARCNHENIVVIHDIGEHRQQPYLVFEYVAGQTLRAWLDERTRRSEEGGPPLEPSLAASLMIPVVRALAYAHDMGIVHRDLKPANIMLTDAGTIKVLDFGIAKLLASADTSITARRISSNTGPNAIIGTLPYMAPEQLEGDGIDHRADLWAVGIMLYEMVTGAHPVIHDDASLPQALLDIAQLDLPMPGAGERRPDLGSLAGIIDRCLIKDRTHRTRDAHVLLQELEAIPAGRRIAVLGHDGNPFAGRAPFQEADADRFYGRARETGAIQARLRSRPLVVLTDPSDVGKSSLVHADVIPQLKRSEAGADMRDVALPEPAATKPIATSALSGPVAPERAPTDIVRTPVGPVKILFFSANTKDGDQLALNEEYRTIEQRIRLARHRDAFQPIFKSATRRDDLQDALLEHSPHVVHFVCHGSSQAESARRSDGPAPDPVAADSLASLFSVLDDSLVLVVFNACLTSAQASVIHQFAKVAIGMRSRIEDGAAITFASALYGALACGRSVQDAFTLGVAALDTRQRRLPELLVRPGVDARKLYLVEPRGSRTLLMVLVAAVVCTALVAAGERRRWPDPDPLPHHPPPVRGMARFAATDVRPGVFDTTRRPTSCSVIEDIEDCAEPAYPERVTSIHVAAFELDVMEVTNGELADWLNANSPLWTTDRWGRIMLRQGGIQLVLASEDCFGALTITQANRVIVSPDKARWPAVCVTWQGATEYCRGQHKRLPLTVEWELAAKGPEGRAFPWGLALPRQDGVTFDLRDGAAPHPRDVGSSPQDVSPEGVHDLGGNVAEWVEDDRGGIDTKMIRGGSWGSRGPCHLLGSSCKRIAAGSYGSDVGFRCASSVIDGN